jgi:hypothetical protein
MPAPPQVWPPVQVPHVTDPPQPSGTTPQLTEPHAVAGSIGEQVLTPPQTFETPPPPHAWLLGHTPQLTIPPQPSAIGPQLAPTSEH